MSIQKEIPANAVEQIVQQVENTTKRLVGDFDPKSEDLGTILRRDPVAEAEMLAEQLAGEITSKERDALILGHGIRVNQYKQDALEKVGDSSFRTSLPRYHQILDELGFEKVLELDFIDRKWKNNPEKFYAFWRSKGGVLLVHDTFNGNLNGGNFYFNWKPDRTKEKPVTFPEYASGGYYIADKTGEVPFSELYPNFGEKTTDPAILERERLWQEKWAREAVFAGSCDCREAIKYRFSVLESNGAFVTPWKAQPFLWLLHHDDTAMGDKSYDYNKINEERIALLPDYVREAINAPRG